MENMDKGLTVSKWVLINCSKMPQNLSAQIVCPSPKVWDFDEKRLHWVSIFSGQRVCNPTLVLPDFYYSSVKITHIMNGWINKEE